MRPLILTCHGHLFKTWKSDLQLLHPFQTLISLTLFKSPPPCQPQKTGEKEKWHLLLNWLFQDEDET